MHGQSKHRTGTSLSSEPIEIIHISLQTMEAMERQQREDARNAHQAMMPLIEKLTANRLQVWHPSTQLQR
jgi:hypothetical protein